MPYPTIDIINPIPRASNSRSSLASSEIRVRAISIIPFPNPRRKREQTAKEKLGDKPKHNEKKAALTRLIIKTDFLPYISATFPHGYEENARPTIKLLDKIPAYNPAPSSVNPGIRDIAMKPL
jgi:hypothetical protein